jgi:putative ABC transport system ATP-binding protein
MTLLTFENVSFSVPLKEKPILDGISLSIRSGDFIVILGSNGSGKSSLLKAINGLIAPTSGKILFQGNPLPASLSKRSRSIATLTQDLNLSTFSQLTVLENCLIALERRRRFSFSLSVKKERTKIISALSQYSQKLADSIDEPISSLSGGERQMVAFAMSVWNPPSLLLLDEHTSALDPQMDAKLMELTHRFACAKQVTTLMSTHNLDHALYGNRLLAMKQGKVVMDVCGPEKELLTREEILKIYSS